uniref:Uncharacterized protein n=1 Tax=viral metagenome TaxID=1070528 RepID=A0A6C0LF42_9ZZZZ
MSADVVSVKEVDYLDEDKPIRGQNFVLLSFLSPEDVLVNKEAYMFSQFLTKFSKDMTTLLDGISAKYSESKDFVDSVKENNAFIFNAKDMSEQYGFYKSIHNQELESSYHRDNNFTTSIRGIKVRGVFDTIEEAKNRSEFIKKIDNKFNIYIAQMGCWCPWSPNPDCLENQEYAETQLNTLMKEYKKNMNDKDVVFEARKTALFPAQSVNTISETNETRAVDENEIILVEPENVPVGTSADTGTNPLDQADEIEMSEIKSSIEQVDAWSSQKLGIQ